MSSFAFFGYFYIPAERLNFIHIFEFITVTTSWNKNFLLLLFCMAQGHNLIKSTFILEHFMGLVQTAYTSRGHAVRARTHQGNNRCLGRLEMLEKDPRYRRFRVCCIICGVVNEFTRREAEITKQQKMRSSSRTNSPATPVPSPTSY